MFKKIVLFLCIVVFASCSPKVSQVSTGSNTQAHHAKKHPVHDLFMRHQDHEMYIF